MTEIWAILVIIFATMIGACGAFLIKKSGKLTFNIKKIITNYMLLSGIMLYGLSPIFNIIAFRGGDVTVLYPFVTFTYIWSSLLAIKFLGEKMSIYKWTGIFFIILGAVLIVR